MNGRWDSGVKGSWTGISKAPYLRALSLFALAAIKGSYEAHLVVRMHFKA
jgi:hypothetical protein